MLQIRKSATRGLAEHGWLSSRHTFSFANYYDPRYVSFGPLRVINEDKVIGGQGFGTHSHSNMEIVSYVLGGALAVSYTHLTLPTICSVSVSVGAVF